MLRGALDYARNMVAHRTAARVQARLRQTLYDHVAALGPAHFTRSRTGDVLLSMVEGIQQLEVYFGQYLPQLFVAAITPVLIFAFVAFVDLPIALVVARRRARHAGRAHALAPHGPHARAWRATRAYAAFGAEFLDAVQGLGTLKAFGQSGARGRSCSPRRASALFQSTMGVLGTNTLARGITDAGIALGAAVALGWGVYRVRAGAMDLAALLVVLMLGVEVFRPLRELRVLLHQGMLGTRRRARASSASSTPRRWSGRFGAPAAGAPPRLEPTRRVRGRDASRYPGGRRAGARRHEPSTCSAGERVGIVGPSGSGKSTVARLLLRFYDPERGRVLVGGRDVRDLPLDQLRSLIAVVSQDTYLFHGTVADNLRMGKPDATPAELDGRGARGQRGRVHPRASRRATTRWWASAACGCRAVSGSASPSRARCCANAPILILDEALSSVDAESEAVIQEALDRLMQGRTTLIFAHRLSSVIGADRIFVLDDGRVVESGTHGELMARGGAYCRLMAAQAQDSGRPRAARRDRLAERRDAGIRRGDGRRRRARRRRLPGRAASCSRKGSAGLASSASSWVSCARLSRAARADVRPRRRARRRADRRRRAERAGRPARQATASRSGSCWSRWPWWRRSRASSTGWSRGWRTTWRTGC